MTIIYLEPRTLYDEAIIGKSSEDQLIYDYDLLIDVIIASSRQYWPDESEEDLYTMAEDHISYNIEGMSENYKNWPIIQRESDE